MDTPSTPSASTPSLSRSSPRLPAIFSGRPDDPMALLVATMLVIWGTLNALFVATPGAIVGMNPIVDAVLQLLTFVGYITWMLFFYLFPSGRFVPRWTRWLALLFGVIFFGLWNFTPFGPLTWRPLLFNAAVLTVWGSFLAAQVYRYAWVSDTAQRQQTKLVVFGVAVALAGSLTTVFTVEAAKTSRPRKWDRRCLACCSWMRSGCSSRSPSACGAALTPLRHRHCYQPHPRLRLAERDAGGGVPRRSGDDPGDLSRPHWPGAAAPTQL